VTLLCNADMGPAEVREYCGLDMAGKNLPLGPAVCVAGVGTAMQQLGMSARAFHRIPSLRSGQASSWRAPSRTLRAWRRSRRITWQRRFSIGLADSSDLRRSWCT